MIRLSRAPAVTATFRNYHSVHNRFCFAAAARHQRMNARASSSTATAATTGLLPHDVGGDLSAFGPLASTIERADDLLDWEVRCHSLFAVLAIKGAVSTDGLRRSIESFTPRQYSSWTYYGKWAAGMTTLLLEAGIITRQELNEALFGTVLITQNGKTNLDSTSMRVEPLFNSGDSVRVRPFAHRGQDDGSSGSGLEWRRPHIRVPGYIYGVRGVVERVCGEHKDPSFLAFGLDAPTVRLYRVRFRMKDVWPEHHDRKCNEDAIEVEVYEHWLETSSESSGHDFQSGNNELFDHTHDGSDCTHTVESSSSHHDHDHSHSHHDHSHDPRPMVEERAATLEGEPRPGKELYSALMKVLIDKDIITPDEVREMSEKLVMAGNTLNGAALVAKAWTDPAFEERLLKDPAAAAAEIDITTSNANAPTVLTVVKNTADVHNLVVCTLCSCYPSGLLGIAPSWYKSREYRSRAVREPRQVLLEFGTSIPESSRIRVHDSTADHRYIVLPERPEGTEGWREDELKALVTRDSMVGVSLPSLPPTT
eukprot:CAMPEP_0172320344 /NCGR_PEP_ID=MMETSP1058-20130122/40329_1 /TAXON_ID=83371 /ORGANISM="Detonula confervacea, Strain CCMP 353" /LENGTH=536 /DNA_ID=CAMNT_0013035595 /DNA_START=66 /DNA_END=1676 /DNA_ORIENTATION=-